MLSLPRACFVGLLRAFVGLLHAVGGRPVELEFFRDDTETVQPCWIYAVASDTALPSNSPCTGTATPGNLIDMQYNFSLGSGDNGNVLGITNNRVPNRSQNFTYDQLNRVLTAQTTSDGTIDLVNCWSEGYVYDDAQAGTGPWGNLIQINPGPSAYTGCTQKSGISYAVNSNNQISGWCYDASGNLLAESAPPCDDVPTYSYNAENQLTSTAGVTYEYDGDGKRVSKSTGTLYWYGGGSDPIAETDASGNTINEYIFFGGKRVAREDSNGDIVYYLADHLGTSRVVSDESGTILDDSDFYPFGGERVVTSSSGNAYKFTGKERDAESDLDYFGARYYGNSMGRWMVPDWAAKPTAVPYAVFGDPQTMNLYQYMRNNPLGGADKDGHCDWCQKLWNGIMGNGYQTNAQLAAQQQPQATVTTTETHSLPKNPEPESAAGPNEAVTLGADAVGLASAIPGVIPEIAGAVPGAPAFAIGLLATGVSVDNDPSSLNLSINATSTALAAMSTFGTGTVASLGTVGGFGLAAGALAWDGANWTSNYVITPVFTPDANQSNTINANGITIPAPDAYDWHQQ